jgi:hypothetical protein
MSSKLTFHPLPSPCSSGTTQQGKPHEDVGVIAVRRSHAALVEDSSVSARSSTRRRSGELCG